MAILVHLFAFKEAGFTVAHCGRRGRGLTASTIRAVVTCRECKRREDDPRPRIIRRPNGPSLVPDPEPEKVSDVQPSRRPPRKAPGSRKQ